MNKVMHIQDASKSFGSSTILKNINLTLNSSQVVGLIGSSGSGKTTLLRCILGLLQFEGQRIHPKPLRMGFLLESQRNLYWLLTVRENLEYFAKLKGLSPPCARMSEVLQDFNLNGYADVEVRKLSLGTRQRAALAVLAIQDLQLLILDEPGNGLDAESLILLENMIRKWRSEERAVLVASHDRQFIDRVCDQVLRLHGGELISEPV